MKESGNISEMFVWPIGTWVKIGPFGNASIDAQIIRVQILPERRAMYQVAYWAGADRKEVWLDEFEINAENPSRMKIGFLIAGEKFDRCGKRLPDGYSGD